MSFTTDTIEKYLAHLLSKGVTKNEIKRRLSSVDKYVRWAYQKGYVGEDEFKQMTEEIAKAVNSPKLNTYNKTTPSPVLPSEMTLDIRHYVGFAVLFVLLAFMGAGLYNQIFKKTTTPFAYTTPLSAGKRIISFQGRLTDSIGNPIIAPIDLTYNFYTVPSGGSPITGSTRVCTASPDQDGIFFYPHRIGPRAKL